MKHHFGDSLDRSNRHWTIVPNRERYAYQIVNLPPGDDATAKIVTVGRQDQDWQRILSMPALEELTLHQPDAKQLRAIKELSQLQRLRITHARPKSIEFLGGLAKLEELVLEYVSGFSDLSPLAVLPRLRSLHMENLRKVSDYSGLAGAPSLRSLSIYGTLDWKQPITDFSFLAYLAKLEMLALWQVNTKAPYPALLPLTQLKRLKRVRIPDDIFASEEYALLQVALPKVEGTQWDACTRYAYSHLSLPEDDPRAALSDATIRAGHPEVRLLYDGRREIADPSSEWFLFLGKGAGRAKCTHPEAEAKCQAFQDRFNQMKTEAKKRLQSMESG